MTGAGKPVLGETPSSAPPAAQDPFKTISPDRSLHSVRSFVLIEDFNRGQFAESEGELLWSAEPAASPQIVFQIDKRDGRNKKKRGSSLKVRLDLSPGQTAKLERKLNFLDVSRAERLLFKIRLRLGGPALGRIRVSLGDASNQKAGSDITGQLTGEARGWTTVAVPMEFFKTLDLDQLTQLNFEFEVPAQGEGLHGSLWIDEIAFYGQGDLNFNSSRDNILGFPGEVLNPARREELLREADSGKFLRKVAEDTWRYFENARDKKTHLIVDNIRTGQNPLVSGYTSPTNIAMDFLAAVSAADLGFFSRQEASQRVRNVLATLERMERHDGFFFNFYETKNLKVTRSYISSVDNGWLGLALVVVRQAFPELRGEATRILNAMNFDKFLDPENNQLLVGFDVPSKDAGEIHYGMLVSEARAASLLAIGKGDFPETHWWFLYRTPPEAWRWQNQTPKGRYKTVDGIEYFQGYYEKDGRKFVPSWGGSLFEFLMPTLVLNEKEFSPEGLGLNDRIATELHRDYALKEKGYPVWGISPAAVENGRNWRYREFGAPSLGVKGYPDEKVVTPHVSFLALDSLPEEALENIRNLLKYDLYGAYGFYDTVQAVTGKVNPQYLALDQGMTLAAIGNYLGKGAIRKRFHQDPIGKKARTLLMKESFFRD